MKRNTKKLILAVIPARGGSKNIPRKNIKILEGIPLIGWTIKSAIGSKIIDRIIVSTDDKKIATKAEKLGAEVPFLRPSSLAKDTTPSLPVIQHAHRYFIDNEKINYDYVILLEPTSPGRQSFHIEEALKVLVKSKVDSVVSVSEVPGHYNYHWQYKMLPGKYLKLVNGNHIKDVIKRRQDLPKTYYRNGAIYAFKSKLLYEKSPNFYGEKSVAYLMDDKYSVDIDNPKDWSEAEKKIKFLNK